MMPGETSPAPPAVRKSRSAFVEIVETLIITLALFVAARWSLQPFTVEGQSMEPTFHNGEYILVDKVTYRLRSPERGDVVVFVYPGDPSLDYIKRIIGVPGDHVTIRNHQVYVNSVPISEPYIAAEPDYAGGSCNYCDVRVPTGDFYVMGDNRNNSSDSHEWGLLPRQNIIGRAWLSYWPLPDLTLMHQPSYPGLK
jgi:signal peptidase I